MDHGLRTNDHDLSSIVRRPLSILYGLLAWVLTHMSFLIPAKRLRETDTLLAFHHPKPSYPFHVILVPKKELHSLTDLEPDDPFLADLIRTVQSLVAEYQLPAYRLIVNGGEYQEFPLLHFHLVSAFQTSDPLAPDS
jgi:histidine triad (HIT) family protein